MSKVKTLVACSWCHLLKDELIQEHWCSENCVNAATAHHAMTGE